VLAIRKSALEQMVALLSDEQKAIWQARIGKPFSFQQTGPGADLGGGDLPQLGFEGGF
jgi:hypothetical protein